MAPRKRDIPNHEVSEDEVSEDEEREQRLRALRAERDNLRERVERLMALRAQRDNLREQLELLRRQRLREIRNDYGRDIMPMEDGSPPAFGRNRNWAILQPQYLDVLEEMRMRHPMYPLEDRMILAIYVVLQRHGDMRHL